MLPTNVRITSARYANAENTLVFVLLDTGETWFVIPNNGSGQANILAAWASGGGNIGPYVPPVPGGVVPPGSLIWYASDRVPSGWLLCDGTQVKRQQYPKLFATIGVTFGAGNGVTTFNLPDLRGKFIRGWGAVNPLDPGREFGSVQGNLLAEHRHTITDPGHTHGVNDPGHLHVVNDPGHTHVGDDPGHSHTVTDPTHAHSIDMYEDNLFFGIQIASSAAVITPYFDNNGPVYGYYSPDTVTNGANLSVVQASANLLTGIGEANVSDLINFTNITVNPAVTNITETDSEGGLQTRPYNLSLLPYIRF
jgi:microcystin-dependent protein